MSYFFLKQLGEYTYVGQGVFQVVRKNANENEDGTPPLTEIDIREAARFVSQHGLKDLPWQLSAESIAQMKPPACAYRNGNALVVISNPQVDHIVLWSLLVEAQVRGHGLGTGTLRAMIAKYPGKTWHVPALFPEELGKTFERAAFERESLSQWQMKLTL